jgi:hypothetical protein
VTLVWWFVESATTNLPWTPHALQYSYSSLTLTSKRSKITSYTTECPSWHPSTYPQPIKIIFYALVWWYAKSPPQTCPNPTHTLQHSYSSLTPMSKRSKITSYTTDCPSSHPSNYPQPIKILSCDPCMMVCRKRHHKLALIPPTPYNIATPHSHNHVKRSKIT